MWTIQYQIRISGTSHYRWYVEQDGLCPFCTTICQRTIGLLVLDKTTEAKKNGSITEP